MNENFKFYVFLEHTDGKDIVREQSNSISDSIKLPKNMPEWHARKRLKVKKSVGNNDFNLPQAKSIAYSRYELYTNYPLQFQSICNPSL